MDERFNFLKDNKIKNKRGRNWVDLPDEDDSSNDSEIESIGAVSYDSSDESFHELNEDDAIDVDFDNLINEAESTNESTHRLAVMHFDFDQYPLTNLAVIIKSGMPASGKIKSIVKYPSQELMDRYEDDIKLGPKEYLRSENDKEYDSDESGDSVEAAKVIRKYQISRLKFYYAIFEFDSVETADAVYNTLDNTSLGDTGLKLDLRFVGNERTFEIPDRFMHLVEKVRPNSTKFKAATLRPSCFSEIKVTDTWDVVPQREEFMKRAFEVSDAELSDVEQYCKMDTESEFSASEAETNGESDTEGPKVKRYRHKRRPANEYRALLGLDPLGDEDKNAIEVNGTDEEEEEEVESIGGSDDSQDEYVVDETAALESDSPSDSEDDDKKSDKDDNPKKSRKVGLHEKTKLMIRERAEKKTSKRNEVLESMKDAVLQDDRFDEFLDQPQEFKITQTHRKYDNAKLFLHMMKTRAVKLGRSVDFTVPDVDGDQNHTSKIAGRTGPPHKKIRRN